MLLRDKKRWRIEQIDEFDDGELDEQKCIQKIEILPGPTKKWRIDELNDSELDKFYCISITWSKILQLFLWSGASFLLYAKPDMCNQRAALRPAVLFGLARVVLFMIVKWYLQMKYVPHFLCHSFRNHLPQALALDQMFTLREVHEQSRENHRPQSKCKFLGHL